jgi:CBS domain-containing protein
MTIGEFVGSRPVFSLQQNMTVSEAARYMAEKNIGAVPVMEANRLVGIFSERDVIKRIVSKDLDPTAVKIGDVMTRDLVVAAANESYDDCLRKMKQAGCRHLPIVSGDQLLGVVSLRDLLQIELTEREEKLEFLNNYLFHLPPDADKRGK